MAFTGTDVVIVGGGIAGISTAYFLGKAGVKSIVVERDSVGGHASGFAYGGLGPLSRAGIPGPVSPVADEGMRLHRQLSRILPEETGVNTEFRVRSSLSLAFTETQVHEAKSTIRWDEQQEDYAVRWLDGTEALSIEPRISEDVLGALHTEGTADLDSYRLVLAMAQAAERHGATIRQGKVRALETSRDRVSAVTPDSDKILCDRVVLAMGPWSGEVSSWLGVPVKVGPLKGQILRIRAPGPPLDCSIGWQGNYATSKPDGLVWAGTTEEEAGFDEAPTSDARARIMASLLKMIPSLADAQLVWHTACLRPLSSDRLPVLGLVPGWEGVYVATGAGRQGILLGPAMGRITADLITKGSSDIPIGAFDPGRFAR